MLACDVLTQAQLNICLVQIDVEQCDYLWKHLIHREYLYNKLKMQFSPLMLSYWNINVNIYIFGLPFENAKLL